MGDELGGHLVSGHVYCMGTVESSQTTGESIDLKIAFPDHVSKYIAEKGYIAIDGISLTVGKVIQIASIYTLSQRHKLPQHCARNK